MLTTAPAFSGFSTDDIAAAKHFYRDVLGVPVAEANGMLTLHFVHGATTLIYPKPDHQPATFTVLNFPVPDIEAAVEGLRARGVQFEDYPGTTNGIQRHGGPLIAWFKDPGGNIVSVLEEPPAPPALGSLILASAEPDRLRDWYAEVFQVPVREGFLAFGAAQLLITGRAETTGPPLEPTRWLVNLHVAEAHAAISRLEEAAVRWVAAVEERPDGIFATFADPDGNHVQIIELNDAYWQRMGG